MSPAQVACAWVLQAPGITAPIIGATKLPQLAELIAAVDIKLSAEEVAALEKPYKPHSILGHAQPSAKAMAAADNYFRTGFALNSWSVTGSSHVIPPRVMLY